MRYDSENRTFDCEPTLTDTQVLEFCRLGYLILEGVVPDDINQRALEYLEGRLPANPSYIPEGMTTQDLERIRKATNSTLLLEDWFIEQVALNPQVSGVLRSLLGKNVGLPVLIGHHAARYIGHMFYWLCGKGDEYRLIGGQAWPHVTPRQIARAYGFEKAEGYLPNWTQTWNYEYAD